MSTQQSQPHHTLIVFSFALAAIIAIGGALILSKPRQENNVPQQIRQEDAVTYTKESIPRQTIISYANAGEFAYAQGPQDAAVTVVEYFDFLCPFSAQSSYTAQQLLRSYKPAPVRFIFRHAPAANRYPASLPAANAALCAKEQGKFIPMYALLFEQQKNIRADDFSSFADALGLDRTAFDACMEQKKYQKWISRDLSDAVALKLQGTPTWFINGRRFTGAMPLDTLTTAIDDELAANSISSRTK